MNDIRKDIRANAEMVVQQMQPSCGFDFGYDARSVEWLDDYIERQRRRNDIDQDFIDSLTNVFGSYLGECVLRSYGGEWEWQEGTWAVRFNERNAVFPFNKVSKQFENGSEDSIYSFFTAIQNTAKKPKWKFWQ